MKGCAFTTNQPPPSPISCISGATYLLFPNLISHSSLRSEKRISACCSATASLLFRNLAVLPLAPIYPVSRSEMHCRQDAIARRSTPASTDWENAITGCVDSGQRYWHRSHRTHDQCDLEDLGLLLIDEAKLRKMPGVP
jgi:hypothetical protein